MAIEEKKTINDKWSKETKEGKNPILTPVFPKDYQGKQVLINADRLIFNARKQLKEEGQEYEGGDIHLFSYNFLGFSTKGSIHFNTSDNEDKSYIVLNSPNIFIGMDNKKEYPVEPAVLGNKNQDFLDKLLNLLKSLLDKLSSEYRHIGDRGGYTSPVGETFETMRKDFDGEGKPTADSIGELRQMIREIKSQHVFIKR